MPSKSENSKMNAERKRRKEKDTVHRKKGKQTTTKKKNRKELIYGNRIKYQKRKYSKNKNNPTKGSQKQNTKCETQNTENFEEKR